MAETKNQRKRNIKRMQKVIIKRVKRNKKKTTTGEKILTGLGIGSSLFGLAGAAKAPVKQPTQAVIANKSDAKNTAKVSKIKEELVKLFGVPTAKADNEDDGTLSALIDESNAMRGQVYNSGSSPASQISSATGVQDNSQGQIVGTTLGDYNAANANSATTVNGVPAALTGANTTSAAPINNSNINSGEGQYAAGVLTAENAAAANVVTATPAPVSTPTPAPVAVQAPITETPIPGNDGEGEPTVNPNPIISSTPAPTNSNIITPPTDIPSSPNLGIPAGVTPQNTDTSSVTATPAPTLVGYAAGGGTPIYNNNGNLQDYNGNPYTQSATQTYVPASPPNLITPPSIPSNPNPGAPNGVTPQNTDTQINANVGTNQSSNTQSLPGFPPNITWQQTKDIIGADSTSSDGNTLFLSNDGQTYSYTYQQWLSGLSPQEQGPVTAAAVQIANSSGQQQTSPSSNAQTDSTATFNFSGGFVTTNTPDQPQVPPPIDSSLAGAPVLGSDSSSSQSLFTNNDSQTPADTTMAPASVAPTDGAVGILNLAKATYAAIPAPINGQDGSFKANGDGTFSFYVSGSTTPTATYQTEEAALAALSGQSGADNSSQVTLNFNNGAITANSEQASPVIAPAQTVAAASQLPSGVPSGSVLNMVDGSYTAPNSTVYTQSADGSYSQAAVDSSNKGNLSLYANVTGEGQAPTISHVDNVLIAGTATNGEVVFAPSVDMNGKSTNNFYTDSSGNNYIQDTSGKYEQISLVGNLGNGKGSVINVGDSYYIVDPSGRATLAVNLETVGGFATSLNGSNLVSIGKTSDGTQVATYSDGSKYVVNGDGSQGLLQGSSIASVVTPGTINTSQAILPGVYVGPNVTSADEGQQAIKAIGGLMNSVAGAGLDGPHMLDGYNYSISNITSGPNEGGKILTVQSDSGDKTYFIDAGGNAFSTVGITAAMAQTNWATVVPNAPSPTISTDNSVQNNVVAGDLSLGSFQKAPGPIDANVIKGIVDLAGETGSDTTVTYTVKSGDTVSQIAKTNNTTVDDIMAANPQITNANIIKPGQTINIPTVIVASANDISSANGLQNAGALPGTETSQTSTQPPAVTGEEVAGILQSASGSTGTATSINGQMGTLMQSGSGYNFVTANGSVNFPDAQSVQAALNGLSPVEQDANGVTFYKNNQGQITDVNGQLGQINSDNTFSVLHVTGTTTSDSAPAQVITTGSLYKGSYDLLVNSPDAVAAGSSLGDGFSINGKAYAFTSDGKTAKTADGQVYNYVFSSDGTTVTLVPVATTSSATVGGSSAQIPASSAATPVVTHVDFNTAGLNDDGTSKMSTTLTAGQQTDDSASSKGITVVPVVTHVNLDTTGLNSDGTSIISATLQNNSAVVAPTVVGPNGTTFNQTVNAQGQVIATDPLTNKTYTVVSLKNGSTAFRENGNSYGYLVYTDAAGKQQTLDVTNFIGTNGSISGVISTDGTIYNLSADGAWAADTSSANSDQPAAKSSPIANIAKQTFATASNPVGAVLKLFNKNSSDQATTNDGNTTLYNLNTKNNPLWVDGATGDIYSYNSSTKDYTPTGQILAGNVNGVLSPADDPGTYKDQSGNLYIIEKSSTGDYVAVDSSGTVLPFSVAAPSDTATVKNLTLSESSGMAKTGGNIVSFFKKGANLMLPGAGSFISNLSPSQDTQFNTWMNNNNISDSSTLTYTYKDPTTGESTQVSMTKGQLKQIQNSVNSAYP